MKIATSLYIGLTFISSTLALRGSHRGSLEQIERRAQEVAGEEEAVDAGAGNFSESLSDFDSSLLADAAEAQLAELEPWSVDAFALYSQEARKGKSKKKSKVSDPRRTGGFQGLVGLARSHRYANIFASTMLY